MTSSNLILALVGIAGTSFTLALSGALMPGPLLTVTVAEAARRGTRAGPLVISGHALLELLLVVLVIKGLGVWLKEPPVIGSIALAGGFLLLVMGITMIRQAPGMSLLPAAATTAKQKLAKSSHPVLLGFLGSLSNPYWIIWWVTIGLGYLATASHYGRAGIITFFLGHIAADFAWYILVAYGISRGRRIASDRSYRNLIRGCGLFLIGFGGWFFHTGWSYFN